MEKKELFEIAKSVFPLKVVLTAKAFKSDFQKNMTISKVVKSVKMIAARKLSIAIGKEVSAKEFDCINDELITYAENNIYFK